MVRALLDGGHTVQPVVRSAERWQATAPPDHARLRPPRVADLSDPAAMAAALQDAACVVSTAHARHTARVLEASPPGARLVLLGSTRRYSRWRDDHGAGVIAGETAFLRAGRAGAMLHPTMIYGASGENNVRRLAALLRRLPVVPLPMGGRSLVQPIHQNDVTACVLAAVSGRWPEARVIPIAGPAPLSYADFVRAVARAARLPAPRIMPVPAAPLIAAAWAARHLLRSSAISPDEIRRLQEDKAFDIAAMGGILRVTPMDLATGLALTFPP